MTNPFAIVQEALQLNLSPRTWREVSRRRITDEKIMSILADLAEGKAWMAELPDGRCGVPVLPTTDIRLKAVMFLHEARNGKAVAQTEIVKAEQEAKDFEAVRALDDETLEREAAKILEAKKVARLSASTDAEFIEVKELRRDDMVAMITASRCGNGDDEEG